MSKQILIDFVGIDNVSKTAKAVETSVKQVGILSTTMGNKITSSSQKTNKSLTDLGSQLRYMSLVAGLAAAGAVAVAKSFVNAAKDMQDSQVKLGVYAASQGVNMDAATQAAQNLYATGLIPLTDASTALSNLLATGMGLDKATKLTNTFLNAIVVGKESITDTFGDALVKATQGVRIFQERQIDATGINTQLSQVYGDFAKTVDMTAASLTKAQKWQAIYNYYMEEGKRFAGAADIAQQTLSGTMSKLSANMTIMKATLGNALVPAFSALADAVRSASLHITNFAQSFPAMSSIVIVGTLVMTVFIAAIAGLGALIPLVMTGIGGLTHIMKLFTTATLVGSAKVLGLTIAIGGLVWIVLKWTGYWDKAMNSMKNLSQKILETINPIQKQSAAVTELNAKLAKQLKDLQQSIFLVTRDFQENMRKWADAHDETVTELITQISDLDKAYKKATDNIKQNFNKATKSMAVDHARKTEDIQRQLAEEISKGVWADQTKIRNLQRELARENEDYAAAIDEKTDARDEDLQDERDTYAAKLAALKKKLEAELKLERDNAELVAQARLWPILDELKERQRAFNERIAQLNEELAVVQKNADAELAAVNSVGDGWGDLNDAIGAATDSVTSMGLESESTFSRMSGPVATVLGSLITWKVGMLVIKGLWGGVGLAAATSTTSILAGTGTMIAATGTLATTLFSLPFAIVAATALIAYGKLKKGLGEYNAQFDDTLTAFDSWRNALNDRVTQLITLRNQGKITNDEFVRGMQGITDQQQQLNSQFSAFYNGQFPGWLNWILNRFSTLQSAASSLVSVLSGGGGAGSSPLPSTISTQTTTPAYPPGITPPTASPITIGGTPVTPPKPPVTPPKPPAPPPTVRYPTMSLEPGMTNSSVTQLQNWLISRKYSIPAGATGHYGSQTKSAVASLQSALGVAAGQYSGYYGPATISKVTAKYPAGYKLGGIIPGSVDTAVPIIAHGGETILPAGVAPVTININNPVVRNDSDIRKIADAVSEVLTSRQVFRHLT